ncbi:hypothetical protein H5411_27845 [Amycolatopsis echigonensis]|uniref:HNH endonuclease n=2 Tax=Amycolatopsis echigonensis TaxID=2576905 RepID=A0A8E2B709_9PSEU|nr:hypothetical protein [Amycolatopsis echigonensis]
MPSTGTTTQRGYGAYHQRIRASLAPRVATGSVRCARCGQLIRSGQAWDLGHADGTGKREYQGPEHATCNRSAGGRTGRSRTLDPAPRPVTRW